METSFTKARAKLASLCNKASQDREIVYIKRRGAPDVALIDADELRALLETDYLLRSPANRSRLLASYERAKRGEGDRVTIEDLREKVGP